MRVRVEGQDGTKLEGDVIGGEIFDERLDFCDLMETFTLRSDDGGFYFVQGWQVRTSLIDLTIH